MLAVPWWAVHGLSADRSEVGPDGRRSQLLEVVTDAGTLLLLCPAPELPAVLSQVARRSRRWALARHPAVATLTRSTVLATVWARRTPYRAASACWRRTARHPLLAGVGAVALAVGLGAFVVAGMQGEPGFGPPPSAAVGRTGFDASGMARIAALAAAKATPPLHLAPAAAPPPPAPPSLANQPPLRAHEDMGFAPYWALGQSTGFNVAGLTTIAYFSVGVNANGTLVESGSGWDGFESQALANLVARAHAAGVRVVLTVSCFSQRVLDQLTSSPTAPATLARAVVAAIGAKNLDGLNIDFEGQGPSDQAGLTALVSTVSAAVHAANPHYQVTMDTYATSAGDPNGFYDIPALEPSVNGFFVMAYNLNLQSTPNATSPLTSAMFSDKLAAAQYASVVPASKVILGVPYFGYDWPTTNGTMGAQATGTPMPVTYSQVMASGHSVYWDPVTDTAWTSYEVGSQWHETYFEDPISVYLVAQMAQAYGLAGVGAWALGMDGNDPQMLAALDGLAPATRQAPPGPASTSASQNTTPVLPPPTSATSAGVATPTTAPTTLPTGLAGSGSTGGTTSTTGAPAGGSSSPSSPSSTTTTTPAGGGATATTYRFTGVWKGKTVSLTLRPTTGALPKETGAPLGTLTGFQTDDPALSCLSSSSGLHVWADAATSDYVVVARQPSDCVDAELTFPMSSPTTTSTTTTTTTTTTTSVAATAGRTTPATGTAP